VEIREWLETFWLPPSSQDSTVWSWCSSRSYSIRSAYNAMFYGQSELLGADIFRR
jgi:hypothetical protein